MASTYKTGLLITGDARGGVRAVQMTAKEIDRFGTAGMNAGEKLKIETGVLEEPVERSG